MNIQKKWKLDERELEEEGLPVGWFPTTEKECLDHTEESGYWKEGTVLNSLMGGAIIWTPFAEYRLAPVLTIDEIPSKDSDTLAQSNLPKDEFHIAIKYAAKFLKSKFLKVDFISQSSSGDTLWKMSGGDIITVDRIDALRFMADARGM